MQDNFADVLLNGDGKNNGADATNVRKTIKIGSESIDKFSGSSTRFKPVDVNKSIQSIDLKPIYPV